jgi:hypothetical protein
MNKLLWKLCGVTMKLLKRARDKGLQSPLVMILLYTLWMILLEPFKKHIHLLMLTARRKQSRVRWVQLCLMKLGRLLVDLVGASGCSRKKLRPDSTIEKYKIRLVAKGYNKKEGEDFFDTYSLVARLTSIQVLLSLATSYGLLVHQMDVKTAFINGKLKEEIYMDQLDGFAVKGQEGRVRKLLKSLYGIKQAPKQWHEKFDKTLTSVGFVVNEADKCVYYHFGGGEEVILCLYVDDILIFGTSLNVIKKVKEFLSQNFEMKDLGEANVILNIKLVREGDGEVTLLQPHYVEKVLSRFGYSDCKPAPTPYDASMILKKNKRMMREQLRYSQIIGSLIYLASAMRSDISFAVSKLSRYVSSPGDDH